MAFVRVVGDLRVRFTDVYREPIVRRGLEVATGSGFVIAPSGLVLTNAHVVDYEPPAGALGGEGAEVLLESKRIEVAIGPGGSIGVLEGAVVARDAELDLAVLQVTAGDLPYLPFGDSDAAEPGRPVRVLGFPFGRQAEVGKRREAGVVPQATVTAGSLSAAREDDGGERRYLQTDASVQPGSSGGPMVDGDGYAIGVVRMKLAREASASGAGFGIPINLVKDFLDAHGLLALLPSVRLRPGVVHSVDWKGLRVELPDGFGDTSPSRLLLDGGEVGGISFRVDRLATPLPADALQALLLEGRAVAGFVPAAAHVERQAMGERRPGPPARLATAYGTTGEGERFQVELAVVDRKDEKVAARFVGPADAVAFNLGLLRRALAGLEADAMRLPLGPTLGGETGGAPLEAVAFPQGEGGTVPVPTGWLVEPAVSGACPSLPPAPSGVSASHPRDYTVVVRALRWSGAGLARAVRGCPGAVPAASGGTAGAPSYARRFQRLGLDLTARAVLVERPGESLLLELEAPTAMLALVQGLHEQWVERVGRGD
jgi:hypothetical protein